jgi:hypothetical protein
MKGIGLIQKTTMRTVSNISTFTQNPDKYTNKTGPNYTEIQLKVTKNENNGSAT